MLFKNAIKEEQMQNSPESYNFITYLWVLLLSILGGTAHNLSKVRNGTITRFSIQEWVGDIVISAFVGVVTFYLCEYYMLNHTLTAAFVGISSHMGTRAIVIIERILFRHSPISIDDTTKSEKK
jgi:hypothetical protein